LGHTTPQRSPLRFDVLTTFPEMFGDDGGAALNLSIPARARAAGLVEWHAHNLRAFTTDKHQKTDDRPFGGGPGMVMMCQPVWDAVHAVEAMDIRRAQRVLLTPQGRPLTQEIVESLSRESRLLLIAGHYEGIDERVIEALAPMELSIGDYVLSGGELAAMVLMDAVIRLLPGALGHDQAAEQDSFSSVEIPSPKIKPRDTRRADPGGAGAEAPPPPPAAASLPAAKRGTLSGQARLLDCPHYTKPREWMGREVPDVLLSGDHGAIAQWRLQQRIRRTIERRPDLDLPYVRGSLGE
jgi:tRNA (guanine37-N1)-methyltransferase